jgi:radical SAM enzyme (TIGR01210 family)
MCGYFNDSFWNPVSDHELTAQVNKAMEHYKDEPVVKIFTSGSFFDNKEIPPATRTNILGELANKTEKIIVESRPEHLSSEKLEETKRLLGSTQFEIGIGLETANDKIREQCINKGFIFKEYQHAAQLVKKHQGMVKTYVLLKPPFLTEQESIEDCTRTVEKIKTITDTVSLNPVNVQRHTLVEYLWKRKQYRPAWLWSVVETLRTTSKNVPMVRLQCDLVGGGSVRGAHNCGTCDTEVLKAITSFSLNQDIHVFDNLECGCRESWCDQLDMENLGFGSFVDLSRSGGL